MSPSTLQAKPLLIKDSLPSWQTHRRTYRVRRFWWGPNKAPENHWQFVGLFVLVFWR